MDIGTIGIDLAKSVFQLHGVDAEGKDALEKKVRRSALLSTLEKLPLVSQRTALICAIRGHMVQLDLIASRAVRRRRHYSKCWRWRKTGACHH